MNKWEKQRKYTLDMIDAMIKYAQGISSDPNSKAYEYALMYFATEMSDDYKKNWEKINGQLDIDREAKYYECE